MSLSMLDIALFYTDKSNGFCINSNDLREILSLDEQIVDTVSAFLSNVCCYKRGYLTVFTYIFM